MRSWYPISVKELDTTLWEPLSIMREKLEMKKKLTLDKSSTENQN